MLSLALFAQSNKRPDTYNLNRAVEAIQQNNLDEAVDYLNKDLAENPKNGYAYSWLALIREYQNEYGNALTFADKAIKYIPPKDTEFVLFALTTRAKIYHKLGEDDKSLDDYARAIKIAPDSLSLYEGRAQLLFELEKYDLSDKDYQKIVDIDHGNVTGYMGLGRNANAQKKYDEAIKEYDYAIKLAPSYSSGYSFRAESYMKQGKYEKAIDDIVSALSIDSDDKAFYLMQDAADSAFIPLKARLEIQMGATPNNGYWPYCLGAICELKEKYKDAISYYQKSNQLDLSALTTRQIAECYDEQGDFDHALEYIEKAIEMDSTRSGFLYYKACYLDHDGKSEEAILTLDRFISENPQDGNGYYRRGWIKDHTKDVDGAIEDYTKAITLEPDYAYSYLNRGVLYRLKGQTGLAKTDFEKVIALDTVPDNGNTAQYAYFYLGQDDKADEFMNKMLAHDGKGNYYDAACLYSLMGEKEKSLNFLEKALETGYRRFAHIRRDRDLNNIRGTAEFEKMLQKYEKIHEQEISADSASVEYDETTSEIPFTKENGLCKVKCKINDLPLHFIFDTGASDVSISSVEATFMLKNDYLDPSDIMGRQNYLNANGEINEGTVINLRKVDFAGLSLNNIKASVIKNQGAPLLLGQSVLGRLGKIEIDNSRKILKITSRKRK